MNINDEIVEDFFSIREEISKNRKWGFDLEEKEFIKGMLFLSPQSYGSRIENYFIEKLNYTKIPAKKASGDFKSKNNKTIEFKASILTPTNDCLNLVQIRLFHNVDYYLCVAFDVRDLNNYQKYVYLLTHTEMEEETKDANSAHGTKEVNKQNNHVELRQSISILENDERFQRWNQNYLIDDFEKVNECIATK